MVVSNLGGPEGSADGAVAVHGDQDSGEDRHGVRDEVERPENRHELRICMVVPTQIPRVRKDRGENVEGDGDEQHQGVGEGEGL